MDSFTPWLPPCNAKLMLMLLKLRKIKYWHSFPSKICVTANSLWHVVVIMAYGRDGGLKKVLQFRYQSLFRNICLLIVHMYCNGTTEQCVLWNWPMDEFYRLTLYRAWMMFHAYPIILCWWFWAIKVDIMDAQILDWLSYPTQKTWVRDPFLGLSISWIWIQVHGFGFDY